MERGLQRPPVAMTIIHFFDHFIAHHLELQWHGQDTPRFRTVPKRIYPVTRLHKVHAEQHPKGVAPPKRLAVSDQNNGVCPAQPLSSLAIQEVTKSRTDNSLHCLE